MRILSTPSQAKTSTGAFGSFLLPPATMIPTGIPGADVYGKRISRPSPTKQAFYACDRMPEPSRDGLTKSVSSGTGLLASALVAKVRLLRHKPANRRLLPALGCSS